MVTALHAAHGADYACRLDATSRFVRVPKGLPVPGLVAGSAEACTPDDCDNFGLDPLPLPKAPSPDAQQAQFESYATGAFPVARGQAWSFRGKTYSAAGVADNAGFREAAMSRARRRILAAAPSAQRPGEHQPDAHSEQPIGG